MSKRVRRRRSLHPPPGSGPAGSQKNWCLVHQKDDQPKECGEVGNVVQITPRRSSRVVLRTSRGLYAAGMTRSKSVVERACRRQITRTRPSRVETEANDQEMREEICELRADATGVPSPARPARIASSVGTTRWEKKEEGGANCQLSLEGWRRLRQAVDETAT